MEYNPEDEVPFIIAVMLFYGVTNPHAWPVAHGEMIGWVIDRGGDPMEYDDMDLISVIDLTHPQGLDGFFRDIRYDLAN